MLSMPVETQEDVDAAVELLRLSDEHKLPRLKAAISRRLNRCVCAVCGMQSISICCLL